jgi:hypothetical protein
MVFESQSSELFLLGIGFAHALPIGKFPMILNALYLHPTYILLPSESALYASYYLLFIPN